MSIFEKLFKLAQVSNYTDNFEGSKKVETRVMNTSKLTDSALTQVYEELELVKSVSFQDGENAVYVRLSGSKNGDLLFFNVVPIVVNVEEVIADEVV